MIFSGGDSFPTDIVDVDDTDDADGDVWGCPLCPLSTIVAALDRTSNGDSGGDRKNMSQKIYFKMANLNDIFSDFGHFSAKKRKLGL